MFILLIILILISVGFYSEGKSQRRGLKFILSIELAIMLSLFMEGTAKSLVLSGILGWAFFQILYFALPITAFITFNMLLYGIKLME